MSLTPVRVTPDLYRLNPPKILYIKKIPHFNNADPPQALDTIGWKVRWVNNREGAQQAKYTERTTVDMMPEREVMPAPNGLHVFESQASEAELNYAISSLQRLFLIIEQGPSKVQSYRGDITKNDPRFWMRNPLPAKDKHRPLKNNILFLRDEGVSPRFEDVMRTLNNYDARLGRFVEMHAKFCLHMMGSDEIEYERMQVQIIHYSVDGGILPHIDAFYPFGNTVGPIFTVNMNKLPKSFDLLPTLKPIGTPALRLYTQPGQITVMDGESRVSWSHAIPEGSSVEAYTVAFKFPRSSRIKEFDATGGICPVLQTLTTENMAEDYRLPHHREYDHMRSLHDKYDVVQDDDCFSVWSRKEALPASTRRAQDDDSGFQEQRKKPQRKEDPRRGKNWRTTKTSLELEYQLCIQNRNARDRIIE